MSAIYGIIAVLFAGVLLAELVRWLWKRMIAAIPTQREAMLRLQNTPGFTDQDRQDLRRAATELASQERGGPLHVDHNHWVSCGGSSFSWMVYMQTSDNARLAYLTRRPDFAMEVFPDGLPQLPRHERVR